MHSKPRERKHTQRKSRVGNIDFRPGAGKATLLCDSAVKQFTGWRESGFCNQTYLDLIPILSVLTDFKT